MKRALVVDSIQHILEEKREASLLRLEALKESLGAEAKSTAGDKHETGRAMIQLEMEQAEQARARAQEALDYLVSLRSAEGSPTVQAGSLVETERGFFFLGPSMGLVKTTEGDVFAVSVASPVGQAMLGKQIGEYAAFPAGEIQIHCIG